MAEYHGLYRAKAVKLQGTTLTAYIPQVFGDTPVAIIEFVGDPPTPPDMGWVLFHGGSPEIPVWMGVGTGGGGGSEGGGEIPPPTGEVAFVHHQAVPSATWTITHDLPFYPNVTVVNSAGDVVEGDIDYPIYTRVVLTFSAAFAGTAYLS